MASSRVLLVLGIAILSSVRGFTAFQPSSNDYWNISSGAQVLGTSGLRNGFDAKAIFGVQLGVEPGQAVFSDSKTIGYTHYVEWQTPAAFRLTRFHLFAAGDDPVYNNEREFAQFVLKARRNAADPYVTVYSFSPSHPYTYVEAGTTALLAVDVPAIDAQYFRAEFVQWNAGRGFDGPRVIELDGFGTAIPSTPSPVPQSRDDLWDVSNGVTVTGSSGFRGGFQSTDIFGSASSIEAGQAVFADGRTNGSTHFVEWSTPTPIALTGFNLFAAGDDAIYNHEREFAQFVLKAKRRSSDPFTTIYTFTPANPYVFIDPISAAILSASLPQTVEAQFFRAEFVQWNAGRNFDGPRVIELDGFGSRLQSPGGPVADWTFEEGTPGQAATTIVDQTGNGHLGHVSGTALFRPSRLSSNGNVALEISGGSHFTPGNSADFNFSNDDFTLEAILNPGPGNTEANRGVIVAQNPENGGLAYLLDYRSENRTVNFALVAPNGFNEFVTATIPNDGFPHHVAAVRRGAALSIYLDKQLTESETVAVVPNLPALGAVALRVGSSSSGYWFQGILDRVRISRGALEPSQFIEYQPALLTIIEHPHSQTVMAGENTTFSVTVSSNAVPSYQWLFNGDVLTGRTDRVLSLTNVQSADAGNYSVQVSAFGQTILSAEAQLVLVFPPSGGPVKDDLFDISQGNRVVQHSGTFPTIRATGMFGDESSSIERGHTIFADGRANGSTHFVEWRTASPISLRRIKLFASGDPPIYFHEREFQSFTLKTKSTPGSATFDRTIHTYNATHPYSLLNPTNSLLIDAEFDGVVAQDFRAEFVQWDAGRGYDGPRIIELDGFGEPLQSRPTTVADWTFEEGAPGQLVRSVQDFSGSSNHITRIIGESAAYVPTSGASGALSVHFPLASSGFSSGLRSADSTEFNLGSEYTVEVSVNPGINTADHNQGILVAQNANTGGVVYGYDYRSEDRRIRFVLVDSEFRGDWVEAHLPNDDKSHHVAGIYRNGALEIHVDKVLIQSKVSNFVPGANPGDVLRVTLGANDVGGFWFHGTLDRVRISRRALSREEFFPHETNPATPLTILQPLENLTVGAGSNATFRVVAAGPTNLTYRWKFNGQILSNQVGDTLHLGNVREADAGTYTVTVFSGSWELSSTATLTIIGSGTGAGAPVITAHPLSRLAGLGLSAHFEVTASSSTPLTYQWFFNGAPISGETNSTLWVVDVAYEDAGAYYVVVSNSSGNTTGVPAVLNVFSSTANGGTVYLDNHRPGVNAPVTDDRGLRVTGPEFLAQLYGAPSGQPLQPVGAAIPFGIGDNAGYFSDSIERVVPSTSPGTEAALEVRVWDSRSGGTFGEAVANGGLHGVSNPILNILGGGGAVPSVLTQLQPFSLGSRPRISRQPADVSAKSGRTVVFDVEATGTGPLNYQWKFNTNVVLAGQISSTLVLSNITEINAGAYSVEVRNHFGLITSIPALLTVLPSDTQAPVINLMSPAAGSTTAPRATLSGTVSDNGSLTRVEWLRDGQLVGPIAVSNGVFTVANVLLSPGTNQFTVTAYDDEGNIGFASVLVTFEASRALWVSAVPAVQEGAQTSIPMMVNSSGDIGALSFSVSYDTNHLAEPSLDWRTGDGNTFTQVNIDQPGVIRGTFVLPGRTIRSGTNTLATVSFRARSVPESLSTPLGLEVQGVYSASGDPIASGTSVTSGEVRILRRQIIADNNANDRLDVGDATAIIRMLTLLDPIRPWDVTGNDLNQNSLLDPGDAVRVLRAVVNLDSQPTVPGRLQGQAVTVAAVAEPYFSLSSETMRLVSGQRIKVRVNLGVLFQITGASFQVNYPMNVLQLENAASHLGGPIVPPSAMSLWNLSSEQDYASQNGTLNFAASAATSWPENSGVLAELTFTVQSGTAAQRFWPVTVTSAEVAAGTDVHSSASVELLLEGRDAAPVSLTVGAFNAATGAFELQLGGDPGTTYRIEASEDLRAWTSLSVITADSGSIRVTDSPTNSVAHRFYRAVEVP